MALYGAAQGWACGRAAGNETRQNAQELRVLLTARKLVQAKLYEIEMSLRGILRGFGLKVGPTTPKRFEVRISDLVSG